MLSRPTVRTAAFALSLSIGLFPGATLARSPEISDPITLTLINSSDTDVAMYIYGALLQEAGYRVDYQTADYAAAFTGVTLGDLDVALCWDTTWDTCQEALDTGDMLNIGSSGIGIREGWWYPAYLTRMCPGLPEWQALKEPACVEALAIAETAPKARFVGAPSDWITYVEETIEAFDLQFESVPSGSPAAMIAAFQGAIQRKEPVIGWGYVPHWLMAQTPGAFVEFPGFEPDCYTDPAWGPIKDKTHDCAPSAGYIWKMMNTELSREAPYATRILYLFQLDTPTLAWGMEQVDVNGVSYEDMAKEWMQNNRDTWAPWLR